MINESFIYHSEFDVEYNILQYPHNTYNIEWNKVSLKYSINIDIPIIALLSDSKWYTTFMIHQLFIFNTYEQNNSLLSSHNHNKQYHFDGFLIIPTINISPYHLIIISYWSLYYIYYFGLYDYFLFIKIHSKSIY